MTSPVAQGTPTRSPYAIMPKGFVGHARVSSVAIHDGGSSAEQSMLAQRRSEIYGMVEVKQKA